MTSKKRELEIVYNLEWKNKPLNGDEKSNMVGILDIPATTLDWKTFKSYLLKNSGAADENVKVSYIDSEEREKPISSQLDFEIALYTFRHKARMNEIITLKLDCVNSKKSIGVRTMTKGLSEVQVKMKPKLKKTEEPPEWFLTYMKKFKDDIIEEMSTICSSKAHQMNIHHARKLKAESYKRARKQPLLLGDPLNDKELSKSAKIERKLESKLEKLEHKTMKIKAKKMALRVSSDSDVGRSSGKNETTNYLHQSINNDVPMNASVIKKGGKPHMVGGEHYCQTWEISNSGTLAWTSDTELRYAWGSQALKPVRKEVPCPPLNPGETGTITVLLEIPKTPNTYECYWHFYHKGRRFGHWLGCEIVVDEHPVTNIPYIPSPRYDVINIQDVYELVLPTSWTTPKKPEEIGEQPPDEILDPFLEDNSEKFATCLTLNNTIQNNEDVGPNNKEEKVIGDILVGPTEELKMLKTVNIASFSEDTDNQSIVSISDSNSSGNSATSDDFVMLKMSPPKSENNTPDLEETFESIPSNPNLNTMNVSSIDSMVNVDNLFSKLSIDNSTFGDDVKSNELTVDFGYSPKIENDKNISLPEETDKEINKASTSNVIQQIPIDLSYKSNQEEFENETGYAYVHYQGHKIPISKKHLSAEYLATAESVPESEIKNLNNFKIDEVVQDKEEPVKDINKTLFPNLPPSMDITDSHERDNANHSNEFCSLFDMSGPMRNECSSTCGLTNSMTASTNENRFFVFPQFYPGYEVVPPLSGNFIDPNLLHYQPVYKYDNLGEGLNYSSCTMYPSSPVPPGYNSTPASTPNTSRGCSSIPNSTEACSPRQSPKESTCPCKADAHFVNSYTTTSIGGHQSAQCEQQQNANTSFFEDYNASGSVHTNLGSSNGNSTTSENVSSGGTKSSQSKLNGSTRGSSRVGVPDLLSGATVVATSAMNTARSVFNMFVPPRNTDCGRWQNGHWVTTNPESKREKNLRLLFEMGFYDRDLNATILARYNDDINAVISELLQ